jgi:hypothetical protein
VIAFAYLVLVGSLIAFSAYAWLLKNVRISVVSTYAFVNPVVAVALGSIFLSEPIRWTTVVAGASIVVAVVLIVTARAPKQKPAAGKAPEALKAAAERRRLRCRLGGCVGFARASVEPRPLAGSGGRTSHKLGR